MAQVKARLIGTAAHLLSKAVITQHRDQRRGDTQQAKVMGNVASHTAQGHRHRAGVGIARHQGIFRHGADIHVGRADDNCTHPRTYFPVFNHIVKWQSKIVNAKTHFSPCKSGQFSL